MKKLVVIGLFCLTGCITTPAQYAHDQAAALCGSPIPEHTPVWTYYDECISHHDSFLAALICGGETRTEACNAAGSCSPKGSAVVNTGYDLAARIESGAITEDQARREWDQYIGGIRMPESEYAAKTDEHNRAARDCYQRAYPQFLATETARQSAVDARDTAPSPVHTSCTQGITGINCTTW